MTDQNLHPQLNEYLQALKEHTPMRDPDLTAKGRADFLAEAEKYQKKESPSWFACLGKRVSSLQFQGNRRLATAIVSVLIALILTFGVVGGTVYASQNSLPNQTLYGIKTFTEDVRLSLTNQTEGKINLLVEFTNRRVEELSGLLNKGEEIPQSTITRLEQQTQNMLSLAADLKGDRAVQSLNQIRSAFQAHEEIVAKLANKEHGNAVEVLSRIQEKLHQKIELAEEGLENPASFQKKMKRPTPSQPSMTPKPGKPEDAGTPEQKGKPDDVGTPKGKGKPEEAGTPQGKGKPEETGPPEDNGKP
jgi:hypothetical protein